MADFCIIIILWKRGVFVRLFVYSFIQLRGLTIPQDYGWLATLKARRHTKKYQNKDHAWLEKRKMLNQNKTLQRLNTTLPQGLRTGNSQVFNTFWNIIRLGVLRIDGLYPLKPHTTIHILWKHLKKTHQSRMSSSVVLKGMPISIHLGNSFAHMLSIIFTK